jgi:Flp pilus assembly protein TadG
MNAKRSSILTDRSGATAVEFALFAVPILLLLFGIVVFGRVIWAQSTLHVAVEDAARCASVNSNLCGTASAVQSYAVAQATGLNLDPSVFTVSAQPCGNQVSANYPFSFAVNQLFPYTITLTAQACFPS